MEEDRIRYAEQYFRDGEADGLEELRVRPIKRLLTHPAKDLLQLRQ